MDLLVPMLKCAGGTLAMALLLLFVGRFFLVLLPGRMLSGWLQPALLPLAYAAAMVAGYAMVGEFPHATAAGPWYMDQSSKMMPAALAVVGVFFAFERISPWLLKWLWMTLLTAAVALVVVRTRWDGWGYFAGGLAGAVLLYRWAFREILKEERLAVIGGLVSWLSVTAGAIVVMRFVDQSIGRMLVALAVLAGVAVILPLVPFMRKVSAAGGAVVVLLYAPLMALAANYNEGFTGPIVPRAVFVLLAMSPLGAALTAGTRARRSLLPAMLASLALAALLAASGLTLAFLKGPSMDATAQ